MGGRVVRRKDLKPRREPPPVDPSKLSPAAKAQRAAYQAERLKREALREQAELRERQKAAKALRADERSEEGEHRSVVPPPP